MGKRITALFIGALCLAGGLAAQTPQPILKGKVIDRGGETVIGAHVKWKNAQGGAVTDLDGNFSIPETGTELVISFLGYKPRHQNQTRTEKPGSHVGRRRTGSGRTRRSRIPVHKRKLRSPAPSRPSRAKDLLSLPTANLDEALTVRWPSAGHANHR